MISEKLSNSEKTYIEEFERMAFCIDDIVYFKVTDNRVHIYYYWNKVKCLYSFAKPTGYLINSYRVKSIY